MVITLHLFLPLSFLPWVHTFDSTEQFRLPVLEMCYIVGHALCRIVDRWPENVLKICSFSLDYLTTFCKVSLFVADDLTT